MKKSVLLWVISFAITLVSAYYQRVTGPTYPLSGSIVVGEEKLSYNFERSHAGVTDHRVEVNIDSRKLSGTLFWKRYKVDEEWNKIEMTDNNRTLSGLLPSQPPAGKLIYKVILSDSKNQFSVPSDEPVIIRFKGEVPPLVLIVHIILIFSAMLLSTRTGLEIFNSNADYKILTILTVLIFILGGFVLGPIVQKYAFGEYWTGFPFGTDLTDNKVLLAFIAWLPALWLVLKNKKPKRWIIFASIFMIIVFLIPHSLFGSELDYTKLK